MQIELYRRMIDMGVAITVLLICAPILVAIALALRWSLGKGIFFLQQRPGLYGRPFIIYKFRTMTNARDANGDLLPDSERLTRLGQILRSTSLDELPELFNVLKGEMSIVGPRPLLMKYLERYSTEQMRRHEVKPGITGWAQVNGRNAISWEDKFKLDVWYVDHQSLWLDLRIIALTILKVFKQEGISQPGHATMEEFLGSNARGMHE
jgi:sugar transferase EpsL